MLHVRRQPGGAKRRSILSAWLRDTENLDFAGEPFLLAEATDLAWLRYCKGLGQSQFSRLSTKSLRASLLVRNNT